MHVQATCPGDNDLAAGLTTYRSLCDEAGMQPVCANLTTAGKECFPPSTVREIAGWRIGIIGAIGRQVPLATRGDHLVAGDPIPAVRGAAAAMRGRVDVIVVLAHMGHLEAVRLGREVVDIDALVVGHGNELVLDRAGRAVLCGPGGQGKSLAALDVDPSETLIPPVTRVRPSFIRLDPGMPEDAEWSRRVGKFHATSAPLLVSS